MKRQRRIYTGEAAADAILEECPRLLEPVDVQITSQTHLVIRDRQTTRFRTYIAWKGGRRDDSEPIAVEATAAALKTAVLGWLKAEQKRQQEARDATLPAPGQTELPFEEPKT